MMDSQNFDATAISTTSSIGGLFILPLPLIVGWLSDRIGRKGLIILIYSLQMLGAILLANATTLPIFWISTMLFSTIGASTTVGSALITDISPPESLSTTMSRYISTMYRWSRP